MIGRVYEFEDLQRILKYQRIADVEAELQRQHIPYFASRKGPWTTEAALNQALGVQPAAGNDEAYKPSELL
jgi:hypothetical protein